MVRVHDVRGCGAGRSGPRSDWQRATMVAPGSGGDDNDDVAGPLGAGARAADVLLDHQGSAGRVGAARGLRAQPPQGPPPGGADLAGAARLHARDLAARLAPQPARVRRSRHRVRARADRSARRARPTAPADLRIDRAPARRTGRADPAAPRGVRRPPARRARRVPPLLAAWSTRVRTRRRHRTLTGRELGAVGREIVAITVEEQHRAARAPPRASGPEWGRS